MLIKTFLLSHEKSERPPSNSDPKSCDAQKISGMRLIIVLAHSVRMREVSMVRNFPVRHMRRSLMDISASVRVYHLDKQFDWVSDIVYIHEVMN